MTDLKNLDPDSLQLDRSMRRLFEESEPQAEPSIDELTALVRGELDPTAVDRLMERVADHPDAMDLLLDLKRGADLDVDRDSPLLASEVASGVEAVIERTATAGSNGVFSGARHLAANAAPAQSWWRWAAAAILVLGLSSFIGSQLREAEHLRQALSASQVEGLERATEFAELRQQLSTLQQPQTHVRVVDLFTTDTLRGIDEPAAEPASFEIVSEQPSMLLLTPRDPIPNMTYELAILDAEGESLWQAPAQADDSGSLVISLPAHFLAPGQWLLRLVPISKTGTPEAGDSSESEQLVLVSRAGSSLADDP